MRVGMSTEDFAEYRQRLGGEPFEYKGELLSVIAKIPYQKFRSRR